MRGFVLLVALVCAGCPGSRGSADARDGARAVPLAGLARVVGLATGNAPHLCARDVDGGVSFWGDGTAGILGDGVAYSSPVPAP